MSHGGKLHFKDGTAADVAPSQTPFSFNPNTIIGQAPYTNVGVVSLGGNQYVPPRDPAAASILNYAPPEGGIFYDRPEELEFDVDPSEPSTIYNTELNPYNPSSEFFPYEPDYSGILSTQAYLENEGMPLRIETAQGPTGQVIAKEGEDAPFLSLIHI